MSIAVETEKPNQRHNTLNLNLLLGIGIFSTLLLITLLFLSVLYLQFLNNRIINLSPVTQYYHSTIRNIFSNILMLDYDSTNLIEVSKNKKTGMFCEYTVYIKPWQDPHEIEKELIKRLYESGLSIQTNHDDLSTINNEINVVISSFSLAKITIKKPDNSVREKLFTEKIKEIENKIKSSLFSIIPSLEIIESLPELFSDNDVIWYHKFYFIINTFPSESESNEVENNLLTKIESHLRTNFPEIEINKQIHPENGKLQFQLHYEGKHFLTIMPKNQGESVANHSSIYPNQRLSLMLNSLDHFGLEQLIYPKTSYAYLSSPIQYQTNPSTNQLTFNRYLDENRDNNSPQETTQYKIAIILDDGGYRNPADDPVLSLTNKITLSIIPDTKYATELAQLADEKGFEIMIHMPMQTRLGVKKGALPSELLITMSEEEIREKTIKAIRQIPQAKGMNNHTGGVFTTKEEPLRFLMKTLKENDLYFIDSVVIGSSKAFQVAQQEGVPSLPRDLFLDHEYSVSKIREYLHTLKQIAKKKGNAIAIGHFRDLTIKVLQEELPKIESEGFQLVHVSELLQ